MASPDTTSLLDPATTPLPDSPTTPLLDSPTTPLPLAAGEWRVDPAKSELGFQTHILFGLIPVRGRYSAYTGELHFDDAGNAGGSLEIEAASVSTGIKKRDAHLRSKDFFAVAEHPHLKFELERLLTDAGGTTTVQGTLRIRGEALPITAPISIENTGPDTLRLAADFTVPHRGSALARTGSGWKKVPETLRIQAALTLGRSR